MGISKEKLIVNEQKWKTDGDLPYFTKDFVSEVTDYNPNTKVVEIMIERNHFASFKIDELNTISGYWKDEEETV